MCAAGTISPVQIPPLYRHKPTGQAYVRIDRKLIYMGMFDQPETQQRYNKFVAELLVGNPKLLMEDGEEITVVEVIDKYLEFAKTYYTDAQGKTNREYANITIVMKLLKQFYGFTPAAKFGPLALRAVREQMIHVRWCRHNINHNVGRIKRMFRWATENELVSGSVYHALQAVQGLRRGRSQAREWQRRISCFPGPALLS